MDHVMKSIAIFGFIVKNSVKDYGYTDPQILTKCKLSREISPSDNLGHEQLFNTKKIWGPRSHFFRGGTFPV